jgi:DNA invertase Pin-like site-specific DNA recombinase
MLIGYARVSTHEQNLTLQTDALKKAGCRKIFDDRVSRAGSERPGSKAALEYVREGDTLLVWRLDRLGRSLKDLIEIIGGLEKRGMGFRSLRKSIDTAISG